MKARHDFPSNLDGAEEHQEYLRQYYASLAMQGILSNQEQFDYTYESAAKEAVTAADALINALNKQP